MTQKQPVVTTVVVNNVSVSPLYVSYWGCYTFSDICTIRALEKKTIHLSNVIFSFVILFRFAKTLYCFF